MQEIDSNTNDIKTAGELERILYGISDSVTFFQRKLQKCTPFSKKTIKVEKCAGSSDFGYTHTFVINKNRGHYLNNLFLVLTLPEINLKEDNLFKENGRLRWCNNIMHNIIESITLSFNDKPISKLDNFSLDFISEFELLEEKYSQYMKFIGNVPELINPQKSLKSKKLVLPIPFFFSKDTGSNIPLFALEKTEITVSIMYKNWENLLIFENQSSIDVNIKVPDSKTDLTKVPSIVEANLYATVTWVSERELENLGKPSNILIENLQVTPRQSINHHVDTIDVSLFFKNAVRKIYFGISNSTYKNSKSIYGIGNDSFIGGIFHRNEPVEILDKVSINYGDSIKEDIDIEFYKFIQPYYYCKRVPNKSGMYVYSYALNEDIEPSGSTNIHRIQDAKMRFFFNDNNKNSQEPLEIVIIGVSHVIGNITKDGLFELPVFS